MALVLADRVQQTGTANTTVSFTFSGTVSGYQAFTVIGNANTTYYGATDTAGNWEVGIGTYTLVGTLLTRNTILSSSNAGAAVTFSGTVTVFVTYPSSRSIYADGTTLTATNSSILPATSGGTGQSVYAVGDIVYASTTTALSKLADVATGNALISGGVGVAPAYGKIGLTTHVSGTLPIANGGTNSTATPTAGGAGYGTGTANAYTAAGTAGQVLTSNGASAPTWGGTFPSGTLMLFVQTAAPTGWTKSVTHDNKALRIVSGVAGSGGSVAFTTAFASQAVSGSVAATAAQTATNQVTTAGGSVAVTVSAGTLAVGIGTLAAGIGTLANAAYTLTTADIPAHTHTITPTVMTGGIASTRNITGTTGSNTPLSAAANTGGGGSHTHVLSGSPSLSGSPALSGAPAVTGQTFTGTSHNHTQDAHSHTSGAFTGTAINLAVQYVDVIIASKD